MDKNKKRQQFERICIDTWKEIYRFIYYKVQNKEEAQDVTQETYARAFAYWCKTEIQIQDDTNYLK